MGLKSFSLLFTLTIIDEKKEEEKSMFNLKNPHTKLTTYMYLRYDDITKVKIFF